jgi:8-oxo-dGTP pyrophosphatase MutT (NUDIX family)
MTDTAFIASLRHRLLPLDASFPADEPPPRQSAVLILLFPLADDVRFVLTRRPHTLARHPGQISLPGGVREKNDATLWDTAVREAHEEIGLRPGRVQPLGRLRPYHLTVSNYLIHPFVAWNPIRPRFRVDRSEVDELIELSISQLIDPASVHEEPWELREQQWRVTFYRFGERTVWGATARILSDLAQTIHGDRPFGATPPGSVLPL